MKGFPATIREVLAFHPGVTLTEGGEIVTTASSLEELPGAVAKLVAACLDVDRRFDC